MTPPARCPRTGERPRTWRRSPRPAHHTPSPVRRLSSLVIAVAVVAGVLAGTSTAPVLAAPWSNSTVRTTGQLSTATVGSSWARMNTPVGSSVSADGNKYQLGGLLGGNTGYVDLVNDSTVPATLTLTMELGTLLGTTPASVCSVSWNQATGACPGTTTVIGTTVLLGQSTPGYTSPTMLPAKEGRIYIKIVVSGVANAVTLTRSTVTPRPATDRTIA